MQIERFTVFGQLHHIFGAFPILVLSILSKQLFFERFDTVKIACAVEVRPFFHCGKGRPALRIHDIGIFKRFFHAVGLGKGTARCLCLFSRDFFNLRHYFISFRMCKYNVHSQAGEQTDCALRNGKRLAVRG